MRLGAAREKDALRGSAVAFPEYQVFGPHLLLLQRQLLLFWLGLGLPDVSGWGAFAFYAIGFAETVRLRMGAWGFEFRSYCDHDQNH